MFKYLKAAFLVRPAVPGLGAVPVNVLAVVCLGILGLAHPGFWLLGIGLETAFVTALATNRRFQRLVEAERTAVENVSTEQTRQQLIQGLPVASQRRLAELEIRCQQALQIQRDAGAEAFVLDANQLAFDKLAWIYLKLLVAKHHLENEDVAAARQQLSRQITEIDRDLSTPVLAAPVRTSKAATRDLLLRRREMLDRKEQSVQEVESDLTRIEAQIELALEQVRLRRVPEAISSNIDLVSQLLDDDAYGEAAYGTSRQAIASVDAARQENTRLPA